MPLMTTLHGLRLLVVLHLDSDPLQVKMIYSLLLSGLQMEVTLCPDGQKLSLPPMDSLFPVESQTGNMSSKARHGAMLEMESLLAYGRASSTHLIPYCQPRDWVLETTVQFLFLRTWGLQLKPGAVGRKDYLFQMRGWIKLLLPKVFYSRYRSTMDQLQAQVSKIKQF